MKGIRVEWSYHYHTPNLFTVRYYASSKRLHFVILIWPLQRV